MMSWWPLPPCIGEVQFDEKWAFVGEKPHDCDPEGPDDDQMGDYWDHVAHDPERRPVLAAIPGARSIENAGAIVGEVEQRLGGETPGLMTGDEDPAYETAIERTFGEPTLPVRGPGRPRIEPERRPPEGLAYATVHKHREGHRAVAVDRRLALGTPGGLEAALAGSGAGVGVNTSSLGRQNGADRGRNAREARKTYRPSKDWQVHEAMTYPTMSGYNFCWAVRTLRVKEDEGRWQGRSPAMAAGLADHIWTWREWFTRPAAQSA